MAAKHNRRIDLAFDARALATTTSVIRATKILQRALAAYPVGSKNHQVLLNALYELTVNFAPIVLELEKHR